MRRGRREQQSFERPQRHLPKAHRRLIIAKRATLGGSPQPHGGVRSAGQRQTRWRRRRERIGMRPTVVEKLHHRHRAPPPPFLKSFPESNHRCQILLQFCAHILPRLGSINCPGREAAEQHPATWDYDEDTNINVKMEDSSNSLLGSSRPASASGIPAADSRFPPETFPSRIPAADSLGHVPSRVSTTGSRNCSAGCTRESRWEAPEVTMRPRPVGRQVKGW
ncbi:uncharacterized protein J3D65DRAFT_313358 [Phyllosticta citribraziliensis]|uniref:Uncharacterized protein n=1 Tax=Phyllosticta citribraziliensis TaxID=989973 RepID=A0ABR1L6Z2_9PEZI